MKLPFNLELAKRESKINTKNVGVKGFSFSELELGRESLPGSKAQMQLTSIMIDDGTVINLSDYERVYRSYAIVFKAFNLRAATVVGKGYDVVPREGTSEEEAKKCYEFMEDNGLVKGTNIFRFVVGSYIYGSFYFEKVEAEGGMPARLVIIDPKTMDYKRTMIGGPIKIIDDKNDPRYGEPEGYVQKIQVSGKIDIVPLDFERIAHFKFGVIGDNFFGTSLITPIYKDTERVTNLGEGYAEAGLRLGFPKMDIEYGIAPTPTTPGQMPTAEMQAKAEQYAKDLAMKDVTIHPWWYKFNILQPNIRSVNLMNDYFVNNMIAATGVPKDFIFGTGETANYATMKELRSGAMAPIIEGDQTAIGEFFENEIFTWVLGKEKGEAVPEVVWEEVVEDVDTEKIKSLVSLYNPGIGLVPLLSRDEVRYLLKSIIEIPTEDEIAKTIGTARKEAPAIASQIKEEHGYHTRVALTEQDNRFISTFAEELLMERKLNVFYKLMLSGVLRQIKKGTKKVTYDYKKLKSVVMPEMKSLFIKGFQKGIKDIKKEHLAEFDIVDKDTLDWLDDYAEEMAKTSIIVATDHIGRILEEAVEKGFSIPKIRNMIQEDFKEYSRNKATLIARTETQRAVNEGRLRGYEKEDVEKAEFLIAPGACEECQPLNGNEYPLNEAKLMIPVHPNCRCTWLPVVEGGK